VQLVEKMAEIIAQEAKALGVNQLFAPVVDLARELRFGRVSFLSMLLYSAQRS
jgi:beta-glucosidase